MLTDHICFYKAFSTVCFFENTVMKMYNDNLLIAFYICFSINVSVYNLE